MYHSQKKSDTLISEEKKQEKIKLCIIIKEKLDEFIMIK
jgi:hypothetical protein